MNSGGNAPVLHWRQLIVDALIGAAALSVAFAAIAETEDVLYMLLIVSAMLGIGLMLEPNVTAQPARDVGPQPLQFAIDSKPAWPAPQATGRCSAVRDEHAMNGMPKHR